MDSKPSNRLKCACFEKCCYFILSLNFQESLIMSNENFPNVPSEFQRTVESFYGCTAGNINSPVWFCGLEWGGGYDPSVPIPVQDLKPYGFEELHCWSAKEYWDSFWSQRSKFCEGVVKLLIGIRDGEYKGEKGIFDRDYLMERNLIGSKGLALILNAFPISMHGTTARENSWKTYQIRMSDGTPLLLKDWTKLDTFNDYSKFVFKYRTDVYSNELQKRRPQLVVCFGRNDGHERLFGVKEGQMPLPESFPCSGNGNNDCLLYMIPHIDSKTYTLVLVTPFPGSHSLNSNIKLDNISKKIKEFGIQYFGDEWLKSWPRERQTEPLTEYEQTEYDILHDRKRKLSDVVKAASAELAKLEELESKFSEVKKEENEHMLDYIKSTKHEQHQLMVNLISQINSLDKAINNMRKQFKSKLL